MSLFAKVHKLRTMGALDVGQPPTPSQWASGILEFSTSAGDGERSVPRRLVLRHAQANPMKGVIFELYKPEFIDVNHPHMRMRGIEPVSLGSGPVCAVVQDWLVIHHWGLSQLQNEM